VREKNENEQVQDDKQKIHPRIQANEAKVVRDFV
jgi:hypothetical protein